MKKDINHNLRLGAIVLVGLILLIGIIYYLGKKQSIFISTTKITATFKDVQGLQSGNNVRFSGITIGIVTDIRIINDSSVLVEMSIRNNAAEFIRENSTAEIATEGLMGSKIINIIPGTGNSPLISEGSMITSQASLNIENFADEAERILIQSKNITKNLEKISGRIRNGEGDLGRLLNDTIISYQLAYSAGKLAEITKSLSEITVKINNGDGDASKLLNSSDITDKMNVILVKLDTTSTNISKFSNDLQIASEQLHSGSGVANQLLFDSVMAKNLDNSIKKLDAGIDAAIEAAETVDNSWLLNVFSGRKKKDDSDDKTTRYKYKEEHYTLD